MKHTSKPKRNSTKQKTAPRATRTKPFIAKTGIAKIKVIGVGGGGGNAISRMMISGERMRGVEFIAINTDAQDLDYAVAHKKIYVGKALTRGLGAGMNPEVGKQAAEENRSEIGQAIEDADIIFLTAGMGGGTGTGASPVIADIAREKGILTIGFITKPFSFEGSQRMVVAQEGVNRLKDKVDALVVIPNDRIFNLINKETPVMKAFGYVDEILKNGVQAIAELINVPGIINVDFADIKTILKDAGVTLIGIGTASGIDRSTKAVNMAVTSPLLETTIDGAKGILFAIAGSRDLKMTEISDIAKVVSANLDTNAKVIFGAYYDRRIKEKNIKVTVIATGFNGMYSSRGALPTLFSAVSDFKKQESSFTIGGDFVMKDKDTKEQSKKSPIMNTIPETREPSEAKSEGTGETDNSWEIPAFLRKKKR